MGRKSLSVRLDGKEYKLRLVRDGQKNLRERFGETPLQTIMSAANDEDRLCALFTEALNWPGSGNEITDGEEFYDLLVDCGYVGQERFYALAMDIAVTSGLVTADVAKRAKESTSRMIRSAYTMAFDEMDGVLDRVSKASDKEPDEEENPTTQPNG